MNFTIGQKLYFVSSNRSWNPSHTIEPGEEVEITKIGNKWVTISSGNPDYRFEKTDPSMTIDGRAFASPGKCYLTKEEYETKRRTQNLWLEFHRMLSNQFSCPPGTTLDNILKAAEILGVELTSHLPKPKE